MRKFIQNISAFFVVCISLYLLLIPVTSFYANKNRLFNLIEKNIFTFQGVHEWGNTRERSRDLVNWNPKQKRGLILGSSTAYRGINPFILDDSTQIDWFNAASSSQGLPTSLALLKLINNDKNISVLLLDIYYGVLKNSGHESCEDWINNSTLPLKDKFYLIRKVAIQPRLILKTLYLSFKKVINEPCKVLKSKKNGSYLGKGFVCSPNGKFKINSKESKICMIDINQNQYIRKIIDFCQENNIKLLINIAPVVESKIFYDLSKLPKNVLLINTSESDFFESIDISTNFYDDHHLTCRGSEVYTKKLSSFIKGEIAKGNLKY